MRFRFPDPMCTKHLMLRYEQNIDKYGEKWGEGMSQKSKPNLNM